MNLSCVFVFVHINNMKKANKKLKKINKNLIFNNKKKSFNNNLCE